MARQMLFIHWKAARWALLPFVVAAFGLPLLVVQRLAGPGAAERGQSFGLLIVESGLVLSPLFPMLAAVTGAVVALTAWSWDHRSGHTYALSLPLSRWRYAGLKFGTGALLILIPTLTMAAGVAIAASAVEPPAGIQAYPGALVLRFMTAALTAYGLLFALAAGTVRTTVILITALLVLLVAGNPFLALVGEFVPAAADVRLTDLFLDAAGSWASPLQVFFGDWMLFDV